MDTKLLVANQLIQSQPLDKRESYFNSLDSMSEIFLDSSKYFIDKRDYNIYSIVKIGDQEWLGENLRYKGVRHYENPNNPNLFYGCLYNWETAQTACPDGWHLPSDEEWNTLEIALGMHPADATNTGYRGNHGTSIKSLTGWNSNGNGDNSSGFNVFPAGEYFSGSFYNFGYAAYFWSATEYDATYTWYRFLYRSNTGVDRNDYVKSGGFSCRYIKNR